MHLVTLVLVFVLLRPDSRQLPGEGFFDPRLVLVANILLLHSIVPYVNYVFSWNSPSWSISTEWFFYLMFPLLLKDIHRTWPWKLALFAAIIGAYGALFALFEIPAYSDPQDLSVMFLASSSPLFRGFEFVLGMASYVMWQTLNRRVIGRAAATGLENRSRAGHRLVGAVGLLGWPGTGAGFSSGRAVIQEFCLVSGLRRADRRCRCGTRSAGVAVVAPAAGLAGRDQFLAVHGAPDHHEGVFPCRGRKQDRAGFAACGFSSLHSCRGGIASFCGKAGPHGDPAPGSTCKAGLKPPRAILALTLCAGWHCWHNIQT